MYVLGFDIGGTKCAVITAEWSGEEIKITLDSEYMMNESDGEIHYGYEAIFHDDGKRYFAAAKGIYNWEGKV